MRCTMGEIIFFVSEGSRLILLLASGVATAHDAFDREPWDSAEVEGEVREFDGSSIFAVLACCSGSVVTALGLVLSCVLV